MAGQGNPRYVQALLQGEEDQASELIEQKKGELTDLKKKVTLEVKRNYVLDQELKELDDKIKLLVQNRIKLEDVMSSSMRLNGEDEDSTRALGEKRAAYEKLFGLLKIHPHYLATLTKRAESGDIPFLVQTVIFSVYGDQNDARDEHLLLELFRTVLEAEVTGCANLGSFMRSNTAFTSMLTAYTRRERGLRALIDTIKEPVMQIIEDEELRLEVNPMKIWNELSNQGVQLPNGTPQEMEQMPQVRELMIPRLEKLMRLCRDFLERFMQCVDFLPYGIRWISRQLRDLVRAKWPDADQYKVASIVGGFVFLRYFTPAIVTPAESNVVELEKTPVQARRNLVLLAKLLQNLSNGVLYGEKETYMSGVNVFIEQHRDYMVAYFDRLCEVEDLDHHLKADMYLEALTSRNRAINISTNEIYMVHRMLCKNITYLPRAGITTSANDPVVAVVNELGTFAPKAVAKEHDVFMNLDVSAATLEQAGGGAGARTASVDEYVKNVVAHLMRYMEPIPDDFTALNLLAHIKVLCRDERMGALASDAVRVLGEYQLDSVAAMQRIIDEMQEDAIERNQLSSFLEKELLSSRTALASVQDHYDQLQAKVNTYRAYLSNVREQAFVVGEATKKGGATDEGMGGGGGASGGGGGAFKMTYFQLADRGVVVDSTAVVDERRAMRFAFTNSSAGVWDLMISENKQNILASRFSLEDLLQKQANEVQCLMLDRKDGLQVLLSVDKLLVLFNSKAARK